MLADRSYDEVPVSEIVKRAGVAQGTFYLYFPNKQSILNALGETLMGFLARNLEQVAAEQPTVIDFLREMQRIVVKKVLPFSGVLPLLDAEKMFFARNADPATPHVQLLETIERLIRRDQATGHAAAEIDAQIAARLIVSGLDRFTRDCRTPKSGFNRDDYAEQMLAFFSRAIGSHL